jgi:hypothetical protein
MHRAASISNHLAWSSHHLGARCTLALIAPVG